MPRFLALYVNKHGRPAAAMLKQDGSSTLEDALQSPCGINEFALQLPDFDGEPVTLVEMPDDEAFRPMIVDVQDNDEVPLSFIDLPDVLTAPEED